MKQRKWILIVGLLIWSLMGNAQTGTQVPLMAEYYWNQLLYNPAFAGEQSQPSIGLSGRFNKVNGDQQPAINAFAHTELEAINSGVGFVNQYHDLGGMCTANLWQMGLVHNFKFPLGEVGHARIGANYSLLHYKNERSPTNLCQEQTTNEAFFKFNMDLGVVFSIQKFYGGFGIKHINEPNFNFFGNTALGRFDRAAFMTAAYRLEFGTRYTLTPSLIVNQELRNNLNNSTLFAANVLFDYNKVVFGGITYFANDPGYHFSINAGGRIAQKYQLSAAYAFKKSDSRTRFELTFGILLKKGEEEEVN